MSDVQASPNYYGHEDRLQRLESGQQEMAVAVGEHGVRLETLTKAVEDGFQATGRALDKFTKHFDETLRPVTEKLEDHGKFIEEARAQQKARSERWSSVRKAVLAIFVAGAGIAVKELVVYIFHALKA